jgi:hypothetical protein
MTTASDDMKETASLAAVSSALRLYAERGALRDLVESRREEGPCYEASFTMAGGPRVRLLCDELRGSLLLRDLLPQAPARGGLALELAALLAERSSSALPPHRRVDPELAELRAARQRGSAGLELRLRGGPQGSDWGWAAARAVNLAHEVVVMVHERWPEYAHRHFGASTE